MTLTAGVGYQLCKPSGPTPTVQEVPRKDAGGIVDKKKEVHEEVEVTPTPPKETPSPPPSPPRRTPRRGTGSPQKKRDGPTPSPLLRLTYVPPPTIITPPKEVAQAQQEPKRWLSKKQKRALAVGSLALGAADFAAAASLYRDESREVITALQSGEVMSAAGQAATLQGTMVLDGTSKVLSGAASVLEYATAFGKSRVDQILGRSAPEDVPVGKPVAPKKPKAPKEPKAPKAPKKPKAPKGQNGGKKEDTGDKDLHEDTWQATWQE